MDPEGWSVCAPVRPLLILPSKKFSIAYGRSGSKVTLFAVEPPARMITFVPERS